jgi:anti-anti-sigma factor
MARGKSAGPAGPIRIVNAADGRHLVLEGNVGAAHARALQEVARELAGAAGPVRVDLGELRHIDCAGIQVLLALDETFRQHGQAFTLESVPPGVQATFRNAGLDSFC